MTESSLKEYIKRTYWIRAKRLLTCSGYLYFIWSFIYIYIYIYIYIWYLLIAFCLQIGISTVPPPMPKFESSDLQEMMVQCLQVNEEDRPTSQEIVLHFLLLLWAYKPIFFCALCRSFSPEVILWRLAMIIALSVEWTSTVMLCVLSLSRSISLNYICNTCCFVDYVCSCHPIFYLRTQTLSPFSWHTSVAFAPHCIVWQT